MCKVLPEAHRRFGLEPSGDRGGGGAGRRQGEQAEKKSLLDQLAEETPVPWVAISRGEWI